MQHSVTINGSDGPAGTGTALLAAIHEYDETQFLEVWVERGLESMCMLANGNQAWLMYLKNHDEECFSTRNPSIPETGQQLEFLLSSGQRDAYPCHWMVPREQAIHGLREFMDEGVRTAALAWHDDNQT